MVLLAKRLLIVALLPVACSAESNGYASSSAGAHSGSGGAAGQQSRAGSPGDDAPIVPEGLTVAALPGGNGVLELTGLTLRKGPSNTELYAALRNTGAIPACHAAISVELYDRAEQSLAAGISGLLTSHFYRLTDGSGTIAACVGPGDVTMAAITDLPADIVLEDVGYVIYRCPYFALDVVPIAGLRIGQVGSVAGSAGTAYTGTLVNGLDVTVSNPSVTVFPVNRVGRPLGVATASGTVELPPGGHWPFETNAVHTPAADQAAYPAAALAKD